MKYLFLFFLLIIVGCAKVENTSDSVLAGSLSQYKVFNQGEYEQALSQNKIIILNFYANWCPICKIEQPEIFAAFNELNNSNVIGFRVNFRDSDTDKSEEDLAREFGITYQHTKIIIRNKEKILKAPDSWTKERYVSEINKVIIN